MYSRHSEVEVEEGPERRAGIDQERETEAGKDPETQNGLGRGAGLGGDRYSK